MQLSFSIDVILGKGAADNNRKCGTSLSLTAKDLASPSEVSTKGNTTCSETDPEKEESSSPKSFTIEWKPSGSDKPSPRKKKRRHYDRSESEFSCSLTEPVLRSPPNARVIPTLSRLAAPRIVPELAAMQTENDTFNSETQNLRLLQKRLSAKNCLPYSMEALRSHGIHHHPHHYPYQPPYVSPVQSLHSAAIPGIFSPQCSLLANTLSNPNFHRTSADQSQRNHFHEKREERTVKLSKIIPPSGSSSSNCRNKDSAADISQDLDNKSSSAGSKSNDEECEKQCEQQDGDDGENTADKNKNTKRKRVGRRLFTGFQILELEKAFALKPYLNRIDRAYISQKVNLTEWQIKTWFQNRRTKEKRLENGLEEEVLISGNAGRLSIDRYSNRPMRIPGYGIQLAPTYGPPDQHLQAAIVEYWRRKTSHEAAASNS